MKERMAGLVFILALCFLLSVLYGESVAVKKGDGKAKKEQNEELSKRIIVEETGLSWNAVEEIFKQADKYHNLTPELILAVIKKESDFNPRALSPQGAVGLGQIMPSIGSWAAEQLDLEGYSTEKLFDPIINIKITSFYLSKLLEKYAGNYHRALTAYNMGSYGMRDYVSRHGTVVSEYSRQILKAKKRIAREMRAAETIN